MTLKQRLGVVSAAVLSIAMTHPAYAQNVDYGALEAMFGQAVTTSATGLPQLASQAPADMQIVTADDIRRSGATTLAQVLEFVPGLDVRTYGALDSEVSVGGFSQVFNPRLLVLINGRQVYIDNYGYTAWNTLPVQLADIRQIEVVEGPASALFGFNAASGVINIITYDPLTDKTNNLNLGIGSDGTYVGSLVSTLNEPGKAGVTVQLGGIRTNEYSTLTLPSGYSYDRNPYEGSYAIDGRAKPSDHTEVTFEITHTDTASNTQSVIYFPGEFTYRFTSYKGGVSADTQLGTLSLQAYLNEDQTSVILPLLNQYHSPTWNQIGVVQASDQFKIGTNNAFRVGLEYRSNRGWDQDIYNGSMSYQDYAIDGMWNWQMTPKLSLTNAVRLDRLSMNRGTPTVAGDPYTQADYNNVLNTPSFNTGLVWIPTDKDTFRLLVGRGVQSPSLVELGFSSSNSAGPLTQIIAGNPYLNPSTTMNYEFDYDRSLAKIESSLSTSFSFSTVQNLLSGGSDLPGVINYPYYIQVSQNIGSGQVFGSKLILKGADPSGWRWKLGYTLEAVRASLTVPPPPVTPYDFNNSTPVSAIVFGLGYSFDKFEADLQGKWQSRYTDILLNSTPSGFLYVPQTISNFVTLDARLAYNITPHVIIAVTGTQLQSNQTIVSVGPEVDRRALVMLTLHD